MNPRLSSVCAVLAVAAALFAGSLVGAPVGGTDVTYTLDADFDKGTAVNVNHDPPNTNQLQLNTKTETFPFIWIALSARGTIAKIDTASGTVLGEFSTTSDGDNAHNTSRTTVNLDGSVWAGNRNQSSVIHVGLKEANQCVDRNGNGAIDTSTGYGDVQPWPGGSYGSSSDVSNAEDECILNYVDTMGGDARHISATKDGDIWVGSYFGDHYFQLIDGATGAILKSGTDTGGPFDCGGYGGLVDKNGIVWSATSGSTIMRWDPSQPTVAGTNPKCLDYNNYGLAIDSGGNIWASTLGEGKVRKFDPAGNLIGTFDQGVGAAQGLAVDANGHVWISSSLFTNVGNSYVAHLKNDGTLVGLVPLPTGGGPTGIAVDAAGKIWSANINSSNATRIDPTKGPLGSDGVTPVGEVDLTVDLPGSSPYNYSDMTGAVVLGSTSPQGTWNVVQDGGVAGMAWGKVRWNTEAEGKVPAGTSILVEARAADSEAGLGGQSYSALTNDTTFSLTGRYLQVQVTLKPDAQGASPVLSDVRVCSAAVTCTTPTPTPTPTPAAAPPPAVQVTAQAPARAKLRVTKQGPLAVTAGQAATYRITVRNTSTTAATKVRLRDTLPSGMTLFRRSTGATFRSGSLTWSVGTLKAGASKSVAVTVRIDKNVGGQRCNTATALASNAKSVSDKACTRIRAVAGAVAPGVTG